MQKHVLEGYVMESSPANEVVAHVSATDEDEGRNAEVVFYVRTFAKQHTASGMLSCLCCVGLNLGFIHGQT